MKNVTFHISFEAESLADFQFANSIVTALKVQSGVNVEVTTNWPTAPAPNVKAPATPAPAPAATAATATPAIPAAPAPEAKATAKVEYTCEDARKAMASKLANHRTALVDKLRSLGAKNISTLPQDKYAEFIDFCNSLTD